MPASLVGPRIRARRQAVGLNQATLAREVGISASYLNLIEHNKRGIAGRTLHALANRLGMDPRELSDHGAGAQVDGLREAAAAHPGLAAELDRVAEFVGRFPGWARLALTLKERDEAGERTIAALTDRLTHDRYLSDTMHLLLSSVTAIQSSLGILAETEELTDDQRRRFTRNAAEESHRLSRTAQDLVDYFDNPDSGESPGAAAPLDAFWTAHNHFAPELEEDPTAPERLAREIAAGAKPAEQAATADALARYARVARALPADAFAAAAAEEAYDPLALAARFGAPLRDVMFRLAHLPPDQAAPEFGLIECDAAGGVLFRKEAGGLSLPRQGGACPLWPLYGAFAQTGRPLRAVMETADGGRWLAIACAWADAPASYDAPAPAIAAMLFTADAGLVAGADASAPTLPVGPQCGICPRDDCGSRRSLFLLA